MPFVPIPETRIMACVWETRVADFEAFVRATGHDATSGMLSIGTDGWKERGYSWNRPGFPQGPAHPVCGVSWEDARAFCLWLTKKEKESGLLQPGQCYRLPNDGEWSLAVGLGRETGDTPEAKSRGVPDVYPWGRAWPPPRNAGNYAGEESLRTKPANWTVLTGYNDGYEGTSPVGAFGANELGLFDMGGNVKEWCLDECNPPDTSRVLRGASWRFDHPLHLLSSCRFAEPKEVRCDNHGFRCVLYRGPP
jgi:formylglycine-generating enzyme required for sulfatase activity